MSETKQDNTVDAQTPESAPAQENVESEKPDHGDDAPAHYEVHVEQYAHYDRSGESGYDESMQDSLRYAAQTPFARFLFDLFKILTRPGTFWKEQDAHPASIGQLHFPHLVVLVGLRAIALFVGKLLQPESDAVSVLVHVLFQIVLMFVSIWTLALLISGILSLGGGGFHYERSLRYVGYAVTPMLFVGIIQIIPIPWMGIACELLAMPWAFVVLGAGVLPYLKVRAERAPTFAGLFCGLMLCVWSLLQLLLPTLLPFAEGVATVP